MIDASARTMPRVGFTVRRTYKAPSTVRVRQTLSDSAGYDSDLESVESRSEKQVPSKRELRSRRWIRQRQATVPPETEEDEEEDSEEEEGAESSDSSDSEDEAGEEAGEADSDAGSISSGSSDSDSAEEESGEEEEETPGQESGVSQSSAPAPTAVEGEQPPSRPGFQTLVPAPGVSVPSQSAEESSSQTNPAQSASQTTSSTSSDAASAVPTSTATEAIEQPLPDSESTTGLEITTSTASGSGSEVTSGASDASTSQISEVEVQGSKAADVGIALGTLALASLFILVGILAYRRRKRSNRDHLERLPDEKSLPEPPTFTLTAPPPVGGPRRQSSIMDEAMGAAYQAESGVGVYPEKSLSSGFYAPTGDEMEKQKGFTTFATPVSPASPTSPPARPSGDLGGQRQSNGMNRFQLYPATGPPPPMPPPVFAMPNQPRDTYEPAQFMDQYRMSLAQTETTATSEGTWGTNFATERARANGGKLPFKDRFFGQI